MSVRNFLLPKKRIEKTGIRQIQSRLRELADDEVAASSAWFFKTGPGQYGEGDQFLGIRVPKLRAEAKRYRHEELATMEKLLKSKWHEERLLSLLMLVHRFQSSDVEGRKEVYDLYVRMMAYVNNWDLVDTSAHPIVGGYLESRSRRPLYRWAKSKVLWERRVAIISTYHFIKRDDFDDTLKLAEILLEDEHDLIQKAVGWMLREVGNRDRAREEDFLRERYSSMPRTMLRYAIEKLPEKRRKAYLKGTV